MEDKNISVRKKVSEDAIDAYLQDWLSEHDSISKAFLEASIIQALDALTLDPLAPDIDLEAFKAEHGEQIHKYFEVLDKQLSNHLFYLAKAFQEKNVPEGGVG